LLFCFFICIYTHLLGHNLTSLSLARNKMMTLDPASFINVSITELDLSYNRLQSLDPFVFLPLNQSLHNLKIGGNPLQVSHLWSSILSPRIQLNLSEFDVADIPIGGDQHFQTDLFSFHHGMKSLNLSGTSFNYLPVEGTYLYKLKFSCRLYYLSFSDPFSTVTS
jgi:Leucine-rich repeat (LRR) protein